MTAGAVVGAGAASGGVVDNTAAGAGVDNTARCIMCFIDAGIRSHHC